MTVLKEFKNLKKATLELLLDYKKKGLLTNQEMDRLTGKGILSPCCAAQLTLGGKRCSCCKENI